MSNDLDPRAIDDLAKSGLASTDINASYSPPDSSFTPGSDGYVIPYYLPDGSAHPKMQRIRYFNPAITGKRYKQPSKKDLGEPCPPYFAQPSIWDYTKPAAHKLIVEGEKKTVAGIKYLGIASVGIGGCWNWSEGRDGDEDEEEEKKKPKIAHKVTPRLKAWITDGHTTCLEAVYDSDVMTKDDVSRAASGLWWELRHLGIDLRLVVLPKGAGGLDDWIMSLPDGSARAAFDALPRIEGWQLPYQSLPEMLTCFGIPFSDKTGFPIHTNEVTLRKFLTQHPQFMNRLWVDVVKHCCMLDDAPFDEANTFKWLCALQQAFPKLSSAVSYQVMVSLAWGHQRNPINEWLATLAWDGVSRLPTFAQRYLKLEATPYLDRVFGNFLVAAVARMARPGVKFDHMLVLQGPQGIGKTRALIGLFGEEYACIAPHTTAIGSRDWLDAGGSGWCLILDELAGLSRVEHTDLKTALSTPSDTYRRAYRRDSETFPRMFVAAATTNEDTYLTDPTGNRRYWGVACTHVNVAGIVADREQLWAEAVALYRAGFDFWDMPPDAAEEAEQRQEEAHIPDLTEERIRMVLARVHSADPAHQPPGRTLINGRDHYFVPSLVLMEAVSGEKYADAKNNGLSKRVRSAMMRVKEWQPVNAWLDGLRRRGYAVSVEWADQQQPKIKFTTTWDSEFGGRKF